MSRYSLEHLADHELLRDLGAIVARDRQTTAEMLAHLAEVDARELFLPAAYSSLYAYCVGELRLSEDAARKRIHAARAARKHPALFDAVADGRLTLTSVVLLAPHLTHENAAGVLAQAAEKSRFEVEKIVAALAPRMDVPETAQVERAARHVDQTAEPFAPDTTPHAARRVATRTATPVAPDRIALSVTVAQATHDKLRYAGELLGHAVPSGDVAEVLDRALDALIAKLETRRFGAASRMRASGTRADRASRGRYVAAAVRHEVWVRDGGQCTFTSATGHRCESRKCLEFDHAKPHACGGEATAENLRLRCRAHNQYTAEQAFGTAKVRGARAAETRDQRAARRVVKVTASEHAPAHVEGESVVPWLRSLGFTVAEARRGEEIAAASGETTLEARVRAAVRGVGRAVGRKVGPVSSALGNPTPEGSRMSHP